MRGDQSRRGTALLALILLLGAGAIPSIAHEGATGVVAERMSAMKSLGEAMKGIAAMLKGEVPYDADVVREAAGAIGRHGGEELISLFPDGSLHGPTEALPAIWQNWDAFVRLADDLTVQAEALAAAAGDTAVMESASRRSFVRLGQVCSACHSDFRQED